MKTLQSKIALVALVLAPLLMPLQSLGVPSTFSIQGRIVRPDGRVLEASSVEFKVRVLTPDSNACILYEETQIKDLSGSGGLFSLTLNDGSGARSDGLGHAFEKTFSNQSAFSIPSTQCGSGSGTVTYTPSSSDERRVIIYFKEAGAGAWEQMPSMRLSSSTYALESQEALKLGGFAVSNMCRVVDGSGSPATAAPLTVAQFAELLNVASGNYAKKETNGTTTLSSVSGNPASGLSAGQIWYDSSSNVLKYYDGSVKTVGTSGGSVTSVGGGTGLLGGPITTSGTLSVDVGTSAGQIVQVQTGGKLPVLDGSNLTNVIASNGYVNGGNSFAANASLGTNDAFTLGFKTNNATRMTIDTAGNVGIGTAVPTSEFHINSSRTSGYSPFLLIQAGKQSGQAASVAYQRANSSLQTLFSFETGASSTPDGYVGSLGGKTGAVYVLSGNGSGSAPAIGVDSAQGLIIGTSGSIVSSFNAQIKPDGSGYFGGNLGIGTSGPGEKLEVAGDVKIGSATTGTIRATNELVLRQDGDTYGPSILRLRNRTGENGAIFETTDPTITLVDFIFKTSANQRNIRYEARTGAQFVAAPEFQFGTAADPTFVVGDTGSAFRKGNVGIGTTSPVSKLQVGTAPAVTANYPLFALGTAPFDGASAGFFTGNSNGTFIGVNAATGYTGDFANFQIDGVSKYKIDHTGNLTVSGTTTSTGNISTSGHILTTGAGTIASAGALLANSGTASTSPTSGSLIVTGGAGISGALNVGSNVFANGSIATVAPTAATSGANQSSPLMSLTANYWNGTVSAVDQWNIQNMLGAGANPSSTLTFSHSGSAGPAQYAFLNGNVGIGTTAPNGSVEINQGNITNKNSLILSNLGPGASGISLNYAAGGTMGLGQESGTTNTISSANRTLQFIVRNNAYDASPQAMIFTQDASTPARTLAVFKGTSSQTAPVLEVQNSAGTALFDVLPGGNVGIGTTNPGAALEVNGNLLVQSANGRLSVVSSSDSSTQRGQFQIADNAGSGMALNVGAGLYGADKAVWFQATESGVTNNRNLVLQPYSGNVGIGTTAPSAKLHIQGGGSAVKQIIDAGGGSAGTSLDFIAYNGGTPSTTSLATNWTGSLSAVVEAGEGFSVSRTATINPVGGALFQVAGNAAIGVSYTGNFTVPPANGLVVEGNVGVGTAAPQATLDVNGFVKLAKNSSAPAVCGAANDGALAMTSTRSLCVCDATSWKQLLAPASDCVW